MPKTVGIIPTAHRAVFQQALSAIKGDSYALIMRLTTDDPPTYSSPTTHWGMNDGSSVPADASLYSDCKAGNFPVVDQASGQPILWGDGGLPSEEDALAAFAAFEFRFDDSDVSPMVVAAGFFADKGVALVPQED